MKAGKLDRRITIQRETAGFDDGYTTVPGGLTNFASRWASWKPANGREIFENHGREAKSGGTFWLRFDSATSTITETDKVSFAGRTWDIVSVNELDRREGVELTVVAGDES